MGSVYAFASGVQSTVDSVHFEFHGVGQYEYELRRDGNTYRLEMPKQKKEFVQKILSTQHEVLSKIALEEPQPESRSVFLITPKSSSVELFDYLTDDPPRLIVDLLPPEGAPQVRNSVKQSPEASYSSKNTLSGVKKMSSKKKFPSIEKSTKSRAPIVEKTYSPENLEIDSKSSARKPASDILILPSQEQSPDIATQLKLQSGIFDGADPDFKRFDLANHEIKEEARIRSQRESYIDFPMLRPENTFLYELLARKPNLAISPDDTEENKQARLLVTLYENKRRNVFNTTIEWFFQKYPGSSHEAGLRFMWADNLFQMWKEARNPEMFDLAMLRYRQAIEVTKNQEAIEWALLLMGFATLDRGDIVGTLRQFEYHLRTRPQSPDRDVARLALAEAFARLNQFDPAVDAYEEVEKNGLSESTRQMASFTKPDVFFQRKDYTKSIELYEAAIQKYPSAAKNYPNAYFNRAAAYFGQRKFKESLRAHLDFLKMFPSHSFAGYAMTRVGELLEALGATQSQVSGAYLETFFRYGQSPSALVARLRLFSARMHEMKPKEMERSLSELEAVAEKSDLPRIQQFKSFMISEGYSRRKDYPKAIEELVRFYQKNPTQSDANLIQDRLIEHIN
ncbi:MAG: tetratricopeptide repeat protein, partial [Bdellovibrio sp.]